MDRFVVGIILLITLWLILPMFGVDSTNLIPQVIEWSTKFILPWILLYWIIRLVKSLEKDE